MNLFMIKPHTPSAMHQPLPKQKRGLVASWFGGTKERNPDVCIWVSRLVNGKWTEAINVANGIQNDTLRYPPGTRYCTKFPAAICCCFTK
jgi:predicted neuraminidase